MKKILLWSWAVLLVGLIASCGNDGTEPVVSETPDFVQIVDAPVVSVALDDEDDDDDEDAGEAGAEGSASASAWVTKKDGGTISAGRYTLVVPPKAIKNHSVKITITISEDDGKVSCELSPHGLTFKKPVTLIMDLSGTTAAPDDAITIYWWDEGAGAWTDVGGTYDPGVPAVWTELPHFSQYSAGRAGW